jgi:ketosteroid isomerase-like protein
MATTATSTREARAVAHRFIDAFNARDHDALLELITGDAEFRKTTGEVLRGGDGLRALLETAQKADIRLVPLRGEQAEPRDGRVHVTVPVNELIGPDDIERIAEFEIAAAHVAAFGLRPAG